MAAVVAGAGWMVVGLVVMAVERKSIKASKPLE